jgi:hypothetical protein
MFTPEHFRAKAAEYKELAKTAQDQDEAREFARRERSFAVLADNEQWLADHDGQTLHASEARSVYDAALLAIGNAGGAATQ